jgi:O-antigen ligase
VIEAQVVLVTDRLNPATNGITRVAPYGPGSSSDAGTLIKRLTLTVFFFICVYPYSIEGIGVNYTFLLLPFVIALVHGKLRYPGDLLTLAIIFYVLVFFIAVLYQVDFAAILPRRFTSFLIFMSMFAYAFITIDEGKTAAFKTALIAISVFLSLESAYRLLDLSAIRAVGFEAKDLVGSQRFGFIYLMAFWLAYLDSQQKALLGVLRYPVLLVLMAGLLLTFSRSSIVALLAVLAIFAFVRHGAWLRNVTVKGVLSAVSTLLGVVVIVVVLFQLFPIAFEFFNVRLFTFFSNENAVVAALDDTSSSEGTRLFIAMNVIEFVARNPLTGSGFLGVWSIPNFPAGSAHGQYVDVLFRTGFVGVLLYLSILLGLLRHLRRHEEALFWGVLSVCVYGLFHETFKESQGAFVLAFLIGMMAQSSRDRRLARRQAGAAAMPVSVQGPSLGMQ